MDPRRPYPGDPAAGLSSFPAEDAPFSDAYVVHLGEDLDGEGFTGAVDTLAKYLYCGSLTGAATFFDRCRGMRADAEACASDGATLRTFGHSTLGFSPDDASSYLLDDLCRGLIARWRDGVPDEVPAQEASLSDPTSLFATQFPEDDPQETLRTEVVARAAEAGISLDSVVSRLQTRLAEQMGNDRESYLIKVLEELVNNFAPKRSFVTRMPPGNVIVEALDGLVRSQGGEDAQRLCLESAMDAPTKEILEEVCGKLRVWLLELANSREHRLAGALSMADQLADHLRDIGRQAGEAAQSLIKPMQSLKEALLGDPNAGKNWLQFRGYFSKRRLVVDRGLSEYFELRLHELVLTAFCRLAQSAGAGLAGAR